MKCPVCEGVRMREVEREGVLIDVCPDCKGVWLDRGELDKLMQGEREYRADDERYGRMFDDAPRQSYNGNNHRDGYDNHGNRHKKKKSMLDVFGDLFD